MSPNPALFYIVVVCCVASNVKHFVASLLRVMLGVNLSWAFIVNGKIGKMKATLPLTMWNKEVLVYTGPDYRASVVLFYYLHYMAQFITLSHTSDAKDTLKSDLFIFLLSRPKNGFGLAV